MRSVIEILWIWILGHSYLVLFIGVLFEGPFVTAGGAFAAALGNMNPTLVIGLSFLGNILPDMFFYVLGRIGRQKILEKYEHIFHITPQRIERIERLFLIHPKKTLFVAKMIPTLAIPALLGAGVVRMRVKTFAWICVVVTIISSLAYFFIGYYFGAFYTKIITYIDYGGYALAAAIVIGFLLVYGSRKLSAILARKVERI